MKKRRIMAAAFSALFATAACADDMAGMSGMSDTVQGQPSAPHTHHHHGLMDAHTKRAILDYKVPNVSLVREDGKAVKLREELDSGRTVVVSFIYTTCTAICPRISATIEQLQDKLGTDIKNVQLVSISIDPEEDTPARLTEYAKKYMAGPNWHHYTGTAEASIEVQRAFDAYRGDKMYHTPVTFIRKPSSQSWIRVDGFATADELLAECRG